MEQIKLPEGYSIKSKDEAAAEADHSAGGEYPVTVELQGNENYEDQTVTAYLCIRTFRDDTGYWLSLSEAGAKVRETGTPLTIRMWYDTTVSSDTVIPTGSPLCCATSPPPTRTTPTTLPSRSESPLTQVTRTLRARGQ